MGPWAKAFLDAWGETPGSDPVSDLRIDTGLITARVEGRPVTLSAPPISPGIWAAVEGSVTPDRQSYELAQVLEHTWDEPLFPSELVRIGADADVAAVAHAVAEAVDGDPSTLLRFRGYRAETVRDEEAWRGGELPALPQPARRPPDSVPKRFGASGIALAGEDLVEVLVRVYRTFAV